MECTGGGGSVVEHLPSVHRDQSSVPNAEWKWDWGRTGERRRGRGWGGSSRLFSKAKDP